jgi:hypothetical protein
MAQRLRRSAKSAHVCLTKPAPSGYTILRAI